MNEPFDNAFVTSLIGERIAGRYVIERVLAAGGMGVVAVGRYPELEQEVAIKFVKPEFAANSTVCARFLREARLAARVKSPHFVRVFDFGRVHPGVPYLVMELLTGHDLTDELEKVGPLAVEVAVDYLLQAMVGLAEVHGLGVVHRDLKPSNLFLAEAGGTRMVKVLDFGVSKEAVSESLTSTGTAVGTPLYMSPEQVRESRDVDVRSDIWALGVILFELVTNAVPFGNDGAPMGELYGLILHTDPVPPRHFVADLPPALEAVILRCLRRNAEERYADVGELAEALRPFAGSGARVDAVRMVLASTKPLERVEASNDDSVPVRAARGVVSPASAPANVARKDSEGSGGRAANASSAETTDDLFASSPRPPKTEGGTKERRPTTMTATRPSPVPGAASTRPKQGTGAAAKVGMGALVVGAALALAAVLAERSPPPGTASTSADHPTAATTLAPVPPAAVPSAPPSPSPSPVASPVASSALPVASASAPSPAAPSSVSAPTGAPPAVRVRQPRRTLGPGKASTPPEDLLDDRK